MTIHAMRDSLTGINRKQLRQTLLDSMGIKSNADIFASKGDPWKTTSAQERKLAQNRALLEKHLREAGANETQFRQYLLERLSDAGLPEPVRYDKQKLAQQRKPKPPARTAGKGSYVAAAQRITRLAQLHKELTADERVAAVTGDKRKEYGHFVMEKV